MQKLFSNILLPVTLNRHAAGSIENGIELANKLECNLHVLYILRPRFYRSWFHASRKKKITAIQQQLLSRIRPGLLLQAIFAEGQPYDEIKAYVLSHDIDMVCVQDGFDPVWPLAMGFHSEKLATETNCAVISNHDNEGLKNCDKIVMPVGSAVPINSLRVAVYLARQFNASIHLVNDNRQTDDNFQSIKRAYHLLKENTDINVICNSFEGRNFRQSVLNYAKSVHAGLIVANVAYRRNQGFFNRLVAREFAYTAKVPLVMVG